MLTIMLPATDDHPMAVAIHLEHSLVSLSKWESEHETPFFSQKEIGHEETLSYIEKMSLDTLPQDWETRLTQEHYLAVTQYINSKQSATWFREEAPSRGSSEIVTNELIYYWMISLQIPFDPCQNWHINRLMTLIKICGIKQTKPKKMSRQQQAEQYRNLNAQRRQQLGTAG